MGKEITLPWSCDTSKIIKNIISWFMLITSPICAFLFYSFFVNANLSTTGAFLLVYGVLGTMVIWPYRLMKWWYDDELPSFRCKMKSDDID